MNKKMLEISLFVLVVQIGFNAALNNHGYSSKSLIPTARFTKSERSRRLEDFDSYLPSRGSSTSYEQPEYEYDSVEDYRRNNYLRYDTRLDNDISLETAPVGRVNTNNYAESAQSSSLSSRRTGPNYRRPYSGVGPSNLGQVQTRKYHRKVNDNTSPEVSSLEDEDISEDETRYIESILSFLKQINNGKVPERTGSSLSDDASPIDKFNAEEDAVHSTNSQRHRNHNNLHTGHPSNIVIPDGYLDTVLLVTDKNLPDIIPVGRPKLGSLKSKDLGPINTNNKRRSDGLDLNDDVANNLSPFPELKYSLKRRLNRKSNGNSRSSLRDKLFSNDDKTGKLSFLRLSSLEDLNLESPLLRSNDQNGLNNRKSNSENFLRLSLSPNNKLIIDQGIVSDLSELLSETLDELNLIPVSLRRTGPSSNRYSRRENSAEGDDLTILSDLRLGSLDISNSKLPIRRNSEPVHRNSKTNLEQHGNNRAALKKLFDEDTAKTLVPYHEGKIKKLRNSRRNENRNDRRDDLPDEFSLDSLFDFRKEGNDDRQDLDDNLSSNLVSRSTTQENMSLEQPLLRSSDENESKSTIDSPNLEYPWTNVMSSSKNKASELKSLTQLRYGEREDKNDDYFNSLGGNTNLRSPKKIKEEVKDTTDTLHLEYPWSDSLSPDSKNHNKKSRLRSKSLLRSSKKEDKDTTDILHLEYPWNNALNPDTKKSSQRPVVPELRTKALLSSPKQKDDKKDTTDVLNLEYPWNDQLGPDNNKNIQLRSQDQEDTLQLEFPWNDELSPNKDKTGKSNSLRRQTDSRQDKEPEDELKLEFPWNDKTSPDKPSSKKTAVRTPDPFYVHPYLRNRNIKKHPNYFRRSYDDFKEQLRSEKKKYRPSIQSNRRLRDGQNLGVVPLARARLENQKTVSIDKPSVVIRFPSFRRHKSLSVRGRRENNETPPLVTTTERSPDSSVNLVGNKQTYNDTIIFPNN